MKIISNIGTVKALQIFNILRFVATFSVGVILSRSVWSLEEISMYESILFLGKTLSFYWVMGLQNAMVSWLPRQSVDEKPYFYAQITGVYTVFGAAMAAILYWGGHWLIPGLTAFDSFPQWGWWCIYLGLTIPGFLIYIFFLLDKNGAAIFWYGLLHFCTFLLAILLPVLRGEGLHTLPFYLCIHAGLTFLFLLFWLLRHGKIGRKWQLLTGFLTASVPFVLHMLVGNSGEYLDGIIVNKLITDDGSFAIYRYGARELPLSTLLVGGLIAGMIPLVVEGFETGMDSVKKEVNKMSRWLFPLSYLLIFISPIVFPLVYSQDFKPSAYVFNVYMLVLMSRLLLPQIPLIAKEHNYALVWVSAIEIAVNVFISLLLGKYFGLVGIAMGTVVSGMLAKCYLMYYAFSKLGVAPSRYLSVRSHMLYSIGLIVCFVIALYI